MMLMLKSLTLFMITKRRRDCRCCLPQELWRAEQHQRHTLDCTLGVRIVGELRTVAFNLCISTGSLMLGSDHARDDAAKSATT